MSPRDGQANSCEHDRIKASSQCNRDPKAVLKPTIAHGYEGEMRGEPGKAKADVLRGCTSECDPSASLGDTAASSSRTPTNLEGVPCTGSMKLRSAGEQVEHYESSLSTTAAAKRPGDDSDEVLMVKIGRGDGG